MLCCAWSAGGEIFDQIIRSGYMSEKVAAEKAGQLLSFLAHAHKKHVIHRCVLIHQHIQCQQPVSGSCFGAVLSIHDWHGAGSTLMPKFV
jgi:hypothetical protein